MRNEIGQSKHPSYEYIEKRYGPENSQMQLSRQFANELGIAHMAVSQTEARMMQVLVSLIEPKKIVEIGTLTGLSCQYFLQSLQEDGIIYTLEKSKEHIALAEKALAPWLARKRCEIIEGDAEVNLPALSAKGPFDAIFIDGNKAAYHRYWQWARENIRQGGMVLIDNVFLGGGVWAAADTELTRFSPKQVVVVQAMIEDIMNDKNFKSTFIPTEEGLLLAVKI
jgi:predicted O-methyltransferase YrrM